MGRLRKWATISLSNLTVDVTVFTFKKYMNRWKNQICTIRSIWFIVNDRSEVSETLARRTLIHVRCTSGEWPFGRSINKRVLNIEWAPIARPKPTSWGIDSSSADGYGCGPLSSQTVNLCKWAMIRQDIPGDTPRLSISNSVHFPGGTVLEILNFFLCVCVRLGWVRLG